jgi:ABC-2 type transport system permease protein
VRPLTTEVTRSANTVAVLPAEPAVGSAPAGWTETGGPLRRPRALWRRRRALRLLVGRDLKVRYASSALGYVWSVLEPLLMGLVYWFVFTQVFHRSVGEDPYIVFLLAGLLPWTWFNTAVADSAKALRHEAKLVRSTNVPREIWVLRVVLSKGVEYVLSLPVLFLFAVANGAQMNWRLLFLVPALLLQAVLILGVGLLLAPLVVIVRDVERLVRILLRLGFYASPVIFAVDDVPAPWDKLFALNPMAGIFELCRAGFFPVELQWAHVLLSVLISTALLLLGWTVFARLERTVLKEI